MTPVKASSTINTRSLRLAIGIGATYAVIGIAWVLWSDMLVASIFPEPDRLALAQHYKGAAFVLVTAIGLVLLVHAGQRRLLSIAAHVQAQELQVQDLFLRHPIPMWVLDRHTRAFLKVNAAAVAQYGYSEEQLLRMTIRDVHLPEDWPALEAALADPSDGFRDYPEARHRRRSGETFYVRVAAYPLRYRQRDALLMQAIDSTQEVLAQQALAQQEAQFRQLHQSLGEGLWMAGVDGRKMLYVSPAFEDIYGRSLAEFMGTRDLWLQAVHPDDRQLALDSSAALHSIGHAACEYRILRPDGSIRWISDRKKAIVDRDGHTVMYGGIVEDITAIRERDEARSLTQAALEQMVRQRTAELERVNGELDAFTRTAAHDLKTPLNGISGFSQLLQLRYGDRLDDTGRGMVERIERSAMQMTALVDDLLALSRVKTAELRLAEVDLAEMAAEVIRNLRSAQPQRTVVFEAPPQLRVLCDGGLAASLLANLLGNAWKFTGRRASAWIRLSARGVEPVVTIEDNGAGFDAARADALFKPFQRFHAQTEFAGSGVGLATCQRIVQRHGGRIWIESEPGRGTAVHFTLAPAATADG